MTSTPWSLGLDRGYVARQSLALDLRLVAVAFAVNALGKRRAFNSVMQSIL
jgi:hypothetical protein